MRFYTISGQYYGNILDSSQNNVFNVIKFIVSIHPTLNGHNKNG